MSRGHGRIQRAIIEQLMEFSHLTADDLCGLIYRGEPRTETHRKVIRQALNSLARGKIVRQSSAFARNGAQCWTFIGTRADHTSEREQLLATKLRQAMVPHLVKD